MKEQRNRERRLRRLAKRMGLRLEKKPYGRCRLFDQYTGFVELDNARDTKTRYGFPAITWDSDTKTNLDRIETFLSERRSRLASSNSIIVTGSFEHPLLRHFVQVA